MKSSFAVAIACFLLGSLPASAGWGAGAIVQRFNTDAATEGMGGAGASAWWHDAPDPWGNPAKLGLHRGISFHRMSSDLAVGLADDINITSGRITLGWGGFGLLLQAGPIDTYLDMGEQIATDEQGNISGTFNSWEESEGLGLGFSLAGAIKQFASDNDQLSLLARHLDVAAGVVRKSYEDQLASDDVLQDSRGGSAEASMTDYGVLARASLYNSLDGPGYLPALDEALHPLSSGWRVTGAYSRSWLNWGDDMLVHVDANQADPFPREYRSGHSLRFELGLPGLLVDVLPAPVVSVFTPMIGFGMAWEEARPGYIWDETLGEWGEYRYAEDTSDDFVEKMDGWELTILGVFSLREGHIEALYGDVDGDTEGWGLAFDLGFFAARYDKATVPQATGLPTVDRESWTVLVDVLKLGEMMNN